MKRIYISLCGVLVLSFIWTMPASAHVVVRPNEALTGDFQTFTVSTPNEREVSFNTLKLDIPSGLQNVSPSVKAGWTISTEKTGSSETVTSITWTGGNVPAGQRDDFTFSAKLPDSETELEWKAYQTYVDGTVVSWNQKESNDAKDDGSATSGPFSVTKVVAQSASERTENKTAQDIASAKSTARVALMTAVLSLIVGILLFLRAPRNKQ